MHFCLWVLVRAGVVSKTLLDFYTTNVVLKQLVANLLVPQFTAGVLAPHIGKLVLLLIILLL